MLLPAPSFPIFFIVNNQLLIINDKENQLTSSNKEVEKAIQCFLGQPSLNFSECNIGDIVIVTNPQ